MTIYQSSISTLSVLLYIFDQIYIVDAEYAYTLYIYDHIAIMNIHTSFITTYLSSMSNFQKLFLPVHINMHHQYYLYNYPSIKFLYHRCPIRIHLHLNDAEKHLPYRSKLILEKIFKIFDIAENRVLAPSKWSDRVVSSKFGISRPENISIHLKNSCLHEWQHFKNEKNNKKTTIWFHF